MAALVVVACMIGSPVPANADPEKASAKCTLIGTAGDDVLRGTKHDDVICGLGGDDKILGLGGDDVIQGGGGDDLLVGGPGTDVLGGGRGDDTLDGLDNATAVDRLRCGRGDDTAKADPPDIPRPKCEHVEQDHQPTDITLAPGTVTENLPSGTVVGTLAAADHDTGDAHTFTLVAGTGSTDNARFSIAGSSLKTAATLDHETTPTLSVRVRVTDGGGLGFEKALTVTVADADDPPVAVDDTKTVTEDDPATAIDVLANDTDADAGPRSVQSVTQPARGTVAITGGGIGLTYKPNANYCNGGVSTDDFTYSLNGGDTATVKVTVTCVDDPPHAVDDAKTVAEDDPATTVDVLANDTDVDGGAISVTSVTQPAHGIVVITGGGSGLTYQPNANSCNDGTPTDDFTYTLAPGGDVATVAVTVTCTDDPPVATDDFASMGEDAPATAIDVLANDSDGGDGGPKVINTVTQPANGAVTITGSGLGLTYKPDANYCNNPPPASPDTFTYTLNGGSSATVSVAVVCSDDAPMAVNDTATVAEDSGANAVDVLANDTDVDGGPHSVQSVTQPANGTAAITGGGSGVSYTPAANYCNNPPGTSPDTFTYTLNGGSSATVSVTVTCTTDSPVVDNSGGTTTYVENDAATPIDAAVTVSDP
ncbi:MAG TPA: Ig-like domain-containing protein, partial [Nocardioides sp.]|nr:Ig-like domain-containing protein [Nocardioides sp.]